MLNTKSWVWSTCIYLVRLTDIWIKVKNICYGESHVLFLHWCSGKCNAFVHIVVIRKSVDKNVAFAASRCHVYLSQNWNSGSASSHTEDSTYTLVKTEIQGMHLHIQKIPHTEKEISNEIEMPHLEIEMPLFKNVYVIRETSNSAFELLLVVCLHYLLHGVVTFNELNVSLLEWKELFCCRSGIELQLLVWRQWNSSSCSLPFSLLKWYSA